MCYFNEFRSRYLMSASSWDKYCCGTKCLPKFFCRCVIRGLSLHYLSFSSEAVLSIECKKCIVSRIYIFSQGAFSSFPTSESWDRYNFRWGSLLQPESFIIPRKVRNSALLATNTFLLFVIE